MSQDAQFTHAHMVRFERLLAASPEKVWAVLTDTRWLPGWYGAGGIAPQVGGKVELMGGHIKGVVTQWNPPQRLATPGTCSIRAMRCHPIPSPT